MGCDIHLYWESKDYYSNEWTLRKKLEGDRDYFLFSLMAGVRNYYGAMPNLFPPRGIPQDVSLETLAEYSVPYNQRYEQNESQHWELGPYRRMTHPDWHSASWLTRSEVAEVVEAHRKAWDEDADEREARRHRAIESVAELTGFTDEERATLRKMFGEEEAYKPPRALIEFLRYSKPEDRLVFWFDN
jgi:hypothetical protein